VYSKDKANTRLSSIRFARINANYMPVSSSHVELLQISSVATIPFWDLFDMVDVYGWMDVICMRYSTSSRIF
jgi:hypothetical protein